PYAARYQTATSINRPILLGFKESLKFLLKEVGKEWMLNRIKTLISSLRKKLEEIPEISIVTPEGTEAGFIHFLIDGWSPAAFCTIMNQRKYMIRPVPEQHLPAPIRVSVGFYNTEDEIKGLVENIVDIINKE
ncbi:MAG: aminotransferase class V-fold PLP-dependent enzyme, partial [Spirochaetaceae bacterium]|nr:aminotransferase class V-fold PLP-dependent enzyme [Spirochaetaceae bacterium]